MDVGTILRMAREKAKISQLALSLNLGVSQRHVSFVESGRSRPGRDLIVNWMREVQAPVSVGNAALLSAGFSLLPDHVLSRSDGLEDVGGVHHRVLDLHDPMPGMIFNADWRMMRLNAGATWLFGRIMREFIETLGDDKTNWDMIAGIAHPGGLLSRMPEPLIIGRRHLAQLRIEQLNRPCMKSRVDALELVLKEKFGEALYVTGATDPEPGLDLCFDTPHGRLSFFTVQTVFKLPQDVAPTTIRTGLWYPADLATRRVLEANVPMRPVLETDQSVA
ncbi:MAG: helix-turn-helix transcriptional regulator [Roseovarius sp.]|uniref:helix-turn-helix domain-containing protein n=1 Tax=Roseovarius sp. TaxID=1486281 RepID=UPI0032ED8949